nr:hypothetical protein [Noviherbaspirillum malthae]
MEIGFPYAAVAAAPAAAGRLFRRVAKQDVLPIQLNAEIGYPLLRLKCIRGQAALRFVVHGLVEFKEVRR